jgi:hypothetical protein
MRDEKGRFQSENQIGEVTRFRRGNTARAESLATKEAFKDALRRVLNLVSEDETIAEKLAKHTVVKALSGAPDSHLWMKLIHDTVDGRKVALEFRNAP